MSVKEPTGGRMSEDQGVQPDGTTQGPDAKPIPQRSLRQLAIRGSMWTFVGYGVSHVLRLGGNLILTRLLFPEAFGIMALVNVFLSGLVMFSDLGLGPSIVQNPRGEEPEFLRTAWTIQVIRGAILWFGALAVSLPAASFYDEPALARFLPVAGFNLLVSSLESTSFLLLQRHLNVVVQTVFGIGLQLFTLCVTTLGALIWRARIELDNLEWAFCTLMQGLPFSGDLGDRSYLWGGIWALILGTLAGRILHMLVTHCLPGPRMGFLFRKEYAHELIHFGKWIFLASILGFFVNFLDRPVLAKFMDPAQLGVYSIGMAIPFSMLAVLRGVASRVLFPVYSELVRERPERLKSRMLRARLILAGVTLPPLWGMVILGPEIADFLYDDRYAEAGVFMQLLAVSVIFSSLVTPVVNVLLSAGDSFRHFLLLLSRSVLFLAAIALGGYLYGTYGIVLGIVIAPALNYPFLVALTRKYGVWEPLFDATCAGISVCVIFLGLWVKYSII